MLEIFLLIFSRYFYVVACSIRRPIYVDIVNIVDDSSKLSCLTKIHSIIESCRRPVELRFKFLLMRETNTTLEAWNDAFRLCFPGISFESKVWKMPDLLSTSLTQRNFDTDVIFARFYLPHIFQDIDRFIYLDNDIVVSVDLADLFQVAMLMQGEKSQFLSKSHKNSNHEIFDRNSRTARKRVDAVTSQLHDKAAPVAFVFEKHPSYKAYISDHLNTSHVLVQRAMRVHGDDVFLNAGVALFDAKKWRREGWTQRAEMIISSNHKNYIYSSQVGDQGLFYVLLQEHVAYLPARFNMRRLPKKTVLMLSDESDPVTGIVHFAGTTGGQAERLCQDPLQYPLFHRAVIPLYLSVVSSFSLVCPSSAFKFSNLCFEAIRAFQKAIPVLHINITYNTGLGLFSWPPRNFNVSDADRRSYLQKQGLALDRSLG